MQQPSVCENSRKVIYFPEEPLTLAHLFFSYYLSASFYSRRLKFELLLPFFTHGSDMCARHRKSGCGQVARPTAGSWGTSSFQHQTTKILKVWFCNGCNVTAHTETRASGPLERVPTRRTPQSRRQKCNLCERANYQPREWWRTAEFQGSAITARLALKAHICGFSRGRTEDCRRGF